MAVKDLIHTEKCLFICNGGSCLKKNAEEVTRAFRSCIKDKNLEDAYHTVRTRCMGRCDDAPVAVVAPDNIWLKNIDPTACDSLLLNLQTEGIKNTKHFLYQMGENHINSDSIPTNQRKNKPTNTMSTPKIPVTILTGFLGSGKTTLLNRILSENHGKKIAVIENEFGEVGVDNELVIGADEEIFEMNNGCICCTVRGDLIRILTRLTKRKDKLDMILIETTGMANPAPVAQTFWVDNDLKDQFSLDAIITMVDTKHVQLHIHDSDECKEQIAFADIVVLNKTDLVNEEEVEQIKSTVRNMNVMCQMYPTENAAVDLTKILDVKAFDLDKKIDLNPQFAEEEFPFEAIVKYQLDKGKYTLVLEEGPDPSIDVLITPFKDLATQKHEATVTFSGDALDVKDKGSLTTNELLRLETLTKLQTFEWDSEGGTLLFFTQHGPDEFNMQLKNDKGTVVEPLEVIEIEHTHSHDDEVTSVGIETSAPLDLKKFNGWMGQLLQTQGPDIFRSKGILYFSDNDNRIVFQGVHMLFDAKPDRPWKGDENKRNQLIFIGRNLDRKMLNEGLKNCLA